MYLVHINNSILAELKKDKIQLIILEIKNSKSNITILGNLKDFLSIIYLSKKYDEHIYISYPHLIN
jgi:hypothetical protein